MARLLLLAHAGRASVGLAALSSLLFSASTAAAQQAPATPPSDVFASSANCQVVLQQKSAEIKAQHSRDWKACHGASACIRAANAKKAEALKQANADLRLCQAGGETTRPPTTSDTPASGPQPLDNIIATPPRDRQPVEIPTNTDPVQGPSPTGRRAPDYGPVVTPSVPSTPVPSTPVPSTPSNTVPTGTPVTPAPESASRYLPPWNNVTGGGQPGTWKSVTFDGNNWLIYTDASGQPWAFRPDGVDLPGSKSDYKYRLDTSSLRIEPWGTDGLTPVADLRVVDKDTRAFITVGTPTKVRGKKLVKPTSTTP